VFPARVNQSLWKTRGAGQRTGRKRGCRVAIGEGSVVEMRADPAAGGDHSNGTRDVPALNASCECPHRRGPLYFNETERTRSGSEECPLTMTIPLFAPEGGFMSWL